MYERFTDRTRKVFALANQEVQRFSHEYLAPEHILLGICKLDDLSMAATILEKAGIDRRKIRLEVEKLIESGPDTIRLGKLPQTPETKLVVESAIGYARGTLKNYVGTEHVLIGLLNIPNTIANTVLFSLGMTLSGTIDIIKKINGEEDEPSHAPAEPYVNFFRLAGAAPDLLAALNAMLDCFCEWPDGQENALIHSGAEADAIRKARIAKNKAEGRES
jgi:ATP-dependent Clp protease ATP-binding subunit ClpC